MTGPASTQVVLERLRTALVEAFRAACAGLDRVALVDFPTYANPGDSAIWLGEQAVLAEPGLPSLVAVADALTYRPEDLRRRLGSNGGVIVTGGGSLGDLWPARQAFRERVLRDFADRRVVQAPQSIHFEDPSAVDRATAALDRHPDLVLMLRERASLALAQRAFRARSLLAPDASFGLPRMAAPRRPGRDVLCLLRDDAESARGAGETPPGTRVRDWDGERRGLLARLHGHFLRASGRGGRGRRRLLRATYAPMARRRVADAAGLLGTARVVVTDRLHGHVLATLLDLPQVLLPDRTGKLRATYEAWTHPLPDVRWSATLPEALATARALLEGNPAP